MAQFFVIDDPRERGKGIDLLSFFFQTDQHFFLPSLLLIYPHGYDESFDMETVLGDSKLRSVPPCTYAPRLAC